MMKTKSKMKTGAGIAMAVILALFTAVAMMPIGAYAGNVSQSSAGSKATGSNVAGSKATGSNVAVSAAKSAASANGDVIFTGEFIDLGDAQLSSSTPYYVNGKASAAGVLGKDGCTAYFDAAEKVLTLQDAEIISGSGSNEYKNNEGGNYHKGVIDYYGAEGHSENVTIVLNGHNTVKSSNPAYYAGIQAECPTSSYKPDLIFKGSGSLDIETCDTACPGNYGIRIESDVTFNGGDISIRNGNNTGALDSDYCGNKAISSVGGCVKINKGTVLAQAGRAYNETSCGIEAQWVDIYGGKLTAKGGSVRGNAVNWEKANRWSLGVKASASTENNGIGIHGGVFTASATTAAEDPGSTAVKTNAMEKAPKMDIQNYVWRTAAADRFTGSSDRKFTWDESQDYTEIAIGSVVKTTEPKGGSISTTPTFASYGEKVTVTATPDTGYALKYITVDGEAITGSTFIMKNKAETVSAVFAKKTFAVKAKASPKKGGRVSGGKTVKYGSSATLKAKAKYGYKFSKWTKKGKKVSGSSTFKVKNVKASCTYTAVFKKRPTVKFTLQKSGSRRIKVHWKPVKGAKGYQVRNNHDKKRVMRVMWTGNNSMHTYTSIRDVKGRTYKYSMRYYKIKHGKKVWSCWSPVKTIKR
ncbi:MAG: hypothetical protein VB031_09145 [Eubacteriaceae bacterium]|nr:hypothetical protein [Eubacteriaceae bacterium]